MLAEVICLAQRNINKSTSEIEDTVEVTVAVCYVYVVEVPL